MPMIRWPFRVACVSIISCFSFGMSFTFTSIRSARFPAGARAQYINKQCNPFRRCIVNGNISINSRFESSNYMPQSCIIRSRNVLLSKANLDASEEQFSVSRRRPSSDKYAYTTTTNAKKSVPIPEDEPILLEMLQKMEGEIIPAAMDLFNGKFCQGELLPNKFVAVLGVSGGCDSVGLLHGLMTLLSSADFITLYGNESRKLSCEIHVAHFDHRKRGDESDGDRILVESLCKEYGVPFHCYYWGDESMSINDGEKPKFSQEVARDWRRNSLSKLLSDCCSEGNAVCPGVVLTAHHADDNDETLMMKFIRGSHLTNLSGIGPTSIFTSHNKGDDQPATLFGRPMISIRKEGIQNFLVKYFQGTEGNQLPWREDSSNSSDEFLRNRVRNELMPLLSELSGGVSAFQKRLQNLETQSKKVKDDIKCRVEERYGWPSNISIQAKNDLGLFRLPARSLDTENEIPPSLDLIDEEAIHKWVSGKMHDDGGGSISYDQLQCLYQQINAYPWKKEWTLDVGGGWMVSRFGDTLDCSNKNETEKATSINMGGEWRIVDYESREENEEMKATLRIFMGEKLNGYVSTDFAVKAVEGHEHMTFTPSWRRGRSPIKVKEFLRGQKVPLHLRGNAPILCCDYDGLERIAAVYVTKEGCGGEWMIDADFEAGNDNFAEVTIYLHVVEEK